MIEEDRHIMVKIEEAAYMRYEEAKEQIKSKDISTIIKHLVKLWFKFYGEDAEEINCGNCEGFAGDVVDLLPEAESFWGDAFSAEFWGFSEEDVSYLTSGHCFILYMGKFYDSECSEGVDHPRDLPFFKIEIEWQKHLKRPSYSKKRKKQLVKD